MPDDFAARPPGLGQLRTALAAIVGAANLRDDTDSLALHGMDIWAPGRHPPVLIVAPASLDELSRTCARIHAAGYAIAPRGAGMSYTGGYVPERPDTISVDLARMDQVLQVRPDDMVVTVQAGCTWATLLAALAPHGLRTPFWGAMSGLRSTIGGGLSQLNAMFGAGQYGTTSESLVALTVVLADGTLLRTGAEGPAGPWYRHYGPDLAGLFCGDCGALGIKAEITLRLIRTPAHEGHASFSFPTGGAMLAALAEIARAGICSESCGFDPALTRIRMARASLGSDIKTLGAVAAREKSLLSGVAAAAKIMRGGRNFVPEDGYPLHLVFEGRSARAIADDIDTARRIARDHTGVEIDNTVAKVIRAVPFPPLNSVLGPQGQRWVPIHGLVALSQAAPLFDAIETTLAAMRPRLDAQAVQTAYLFTHLSTNAIIVEPVFYWPGARHPIHATALEPAHLARLPADTGDHPDAIALVLEARTAIQAQFDAFGCAHFQIGRTYPYRASRTPAAWSLLAAAKAHLDPSNMMNPGVLGLAPRCGDE